MPSRKKYIAEAGRAPRPEPIDWQEVRRLYVEEQLTYAEVARRMGRSMGGVKYALLSHGVPGRPRVRHFTAKWGKRLSGVWTLMKAKCRDPSNSSYKHYGAQGIDYCPEWERFAAFYRWAMQSGYRPGKPLVLEDWARLFSPVSCYWAAAKDRVKLRLRVRPPSPRRLITAFGETKGLMEWVKDPRCRVDRGTLRHRIGRGYTQEDAITLAPEATRYQETRRRARRPLRREPEAKVKKLHWAKAVRLHRQGMSPYGIARALGANYPTVLAGLKQRGLYRPRLQGLRHAKLSVPLHGLWFKIRRICARIRRPQGVRLCAEWSTFAPFYRWALESGYRRGQYLVRRDRKAGFSPANCVWVSKTKTSRLADYAPPMPEPKWVIQAFGERKGPTAWSKDPRCLVSMPALVKRLRAGMDPEDAITKPGRNGWPRGRPRRKA